MSSAPLKDPAMVRSRSAEPFAREAGAGPGVVCLHANASNSGQWRALSEQLATRFHVLAPDFFDCGRDSLWAGKRVTSLKDEAAWIEPVVARAGEPLILVGHSYGAAVAMIAALARPERVRALVVYEPTLFSLLDAESASPNDADGIREAAGDAAEAAALGDLDGAARRFIDYWMGAGAWGRTPELRKPAIAASMNNVRRWAQALFDEPTPLAAFRSLDLPVLYMVGAISPPSTRGVARLMATVLPHAEFQMFEDLGHMGPVTDPAQVNEAISIFLNRVVPQTDSTA